MYIRERHLAGHLVIVHILGTAFVEDGFLIRGGQVVVSWIGDIILSLFGLPLECS